MRSEEEPPQADLALGRRVSERPSVAPPRAAGVLVTLTDEMGSPDGMTADAASALPPGAPWYRPLPAVGS